MTDYLKIFFAALLSGFVFCADASADVRLKDIVNIEGVRGNDLVGYGLVVGLNGTGDGMRNSPYTEEALSSLLERLGVNVQGEDFRPRNIAAVIVTGTLPPFARAGSQIDITVSAIGDAKNLLGGTLIMTPLHSGDGQVYAVAQGPVLASGFSAEGDGASVTFGAPTTGSIPQGARVEREIDFNFEEMKTLRLSLRSPDFTTAARVESAINKSFGRPVAHLIDPGTIELAMADMPMSPVHMIGQIENIRVTPEQKARIVIDQKSGTVVLGADVKISRFAVTQGNLTITVRETPFVSQPNPFSRNGETIVLPDTTISVDTNSEKRIAEIDDNVSLSDLIEGLNALGVGPRELIDILKSVKAAGALHAELVLM
ncbi:flagellar basal body P-ring protein FlgI [Hyphococcus sp.]|uniref:flagellar basal body P-ring protein FlgI n=1 Tax=Hyphococcus sp. TaxID=2038636 RepID=UPI00207FF766|nr:MAG: flagellar P-ring protein [Marinicaulis sp.]